MMKKVEGKPDIPTGAVRAFVLCGGAGTRLRPLLADQPKSMAPMLELFTTKDADMVIVLQAVADVTRYGSVAVDHDGRITQFVEKGASAGPGLINAGVYLVRKQIVCDLPAGTVISLENDVFPSLLGRPVYGLISTGLFIDIGIPDDFKRAQALLASRVGTASHYSSAPASPSILGDTT